jgi:hypothetical protein
MANLQKFRAHEALNTTAAGGWSQATNVSGGMVGDGSSAIAAGSSANVNNTIHFDLASTTHQIMVYSAGDIYFNFATSDLDVVANYDLILPGGSLTSLAVPVGMRSARSDTIRFNFQSTGSACVVRIVEV